ncbi:MAG TPA: helix-turn-helix transcriptional regulator [Terriglobia bacterium]|nr:helix-turn-helix transcriptional regulator [Terriglobia bacterium]
MADGVTNTHVRQQIRRLRLSKGLTQRELARVAGISPSSLGCLESGFYRLNVDTLHKILVALNVDVTDIWPSLKHRNTAGGELFLLPGTDEVSFFRLREVHLLASAHASSLYGITRQRDEAGGESNGTSPADPRPLYTVNVDEDERRWLAQRLRDGALAAPWTKYSHCQGTRCLFLCLKGASIKPWLENLIEHYLPTWLAAFQV